MYEQGVFQSLARDCFSYNRHSLGTTTILRLGILAFFLQLDTPQA